MGEPALVDNDVVLKLCAYGRHGALADALGGTPIAMLSVGRYALRDRARRSSAVADRARLAAALEEAFASLGLAQPDEAEVALAAEMEEAAAARSLEFDSGESLLVAILLRRAAPLLLTGDKRAIAAIDRLGIEGAAGRIACLEQLVATLLVVGDPATLRDAVCAEPGADRSVTACFACSAGAFAAADALAGLRSYVAHLRAATGATLVPGDDLTGWNA